MPGRGVAQRRLVRADGKGQQDEDEDGEGDDLPQGDPRAAPQCGGPCRPPARRHATWVAPGARRLGRAAVGTAVSVTRRPPGSSPVTRPPPMDTTRSARGTESSGSWDDSSTRRPVRHGVADQLSEQGARRGIEPGVRLVEQPERGTAGQQRGERDPATLAGRQPAGRRGAQATGQAEALERLVGALHGQAEGAYGELDVLRRAELVVERGGMPQEPDVAAHRGVIRGEVDPEDGGFPRRDRQQPGAGTQQAGLAGAVGADDDDDLTLVEREIDPGKGREAAGECDRGTKVDDRGHGLPHHGRGGGYQGSKRGQARPRAAQRPRPGGASAHVGQGVDRLERAGPSPPRPGRTAQGHLVATRRSAVSRSAGLNRRCAGRAGCTAR